MPQSLCSFVKKYPRKFSNLLYKNSKFLCSYQIYLYMHLKIESMNNNLKKLCRDFFRITSQFFQIFQLDLAAYRQVSLESGEQFSDRHGLIHMETSAKSGENVDLILYQIGEIFWLNSKNNKVKTNDSIVIVKSKNNKKKCC